MVRVWTAWIDRESRSPRIIPASLLSCAGCSSREFDVVAVVGDGHASLA
jgi:hypothetical protein